MSSPSLVKLGPRTSENLSVEVTRPLKFNRYLALASFDSYCGAEYQLNNIQFSTLLHFN